MCANILWQGMRPQIDGSSKTTAFYPPIAVDQKVWKRKSLQVPRVASASSVLGEGSISPLTLLVLDFFFLRQLVHLWWSWQTIGCPNSRLSFVCFCILKFWGVRVWWVGMVFSLLRRQSGGKCHECSQSPISTGITAERFNPDFENKILATRGVGLGENCVSSSWLVGPEFWCKITTSSKLRLCMFIIQSGLLEKSPVFENYYSKALRKKSQMWPRCSVCWKVFLRRFSKTPAISFPITSIK